MRKFNIRNPETQNELTEPEEFNLMFQSSIGPTGHIKGCVFFFFPLLSNLNHPGVLIREVTNSGPLRFFFSPVSSDPRLPRVTLSTFPVCSSSTTVVFRSPRPRLVGRSETRSPPGKVSSEFESSPWPRSSISSTLTRRRMRGLRRLRRLGSCCCLRMFRRRERRS